MRQCYKLKSVPGITTGCVVKRDIHPVLSQDATWALFFYFTVFVYQTNHGGNYRRTDLLVLKNELVESLAAWTSNTCLGAEI